MTKVMNSKHTYQSRWGWLLELPLSWRPLAPASANALDEAQAQVFVRADDDRKSFAWSASALTLDRATAFQLSALMGCLGTLPIDNLRLLDGLVPSIGEVVQAEVVNVNGLQAIEVLEEFYQPALSEMKRAYFLILLNAAGDGQLKVHCFSFFAPLVEFARTVEEVKSICKTFRLVEVIAGNPPGMIWP